MDITIERETVEGPTGDGVFGFRFTIRRDSDRRPRIHFGFSVVELMVVVSILMILGGLLLPVFSNARAAAKDRVCASNLGQTYKAIALYAVDYDDRFPRGKDCVDDAQILTFPENLREQLRLAPLLPDLLHTYTRERRIFSCPRDVGVRVMEALFPRPIDLIPTAFERCGLSYEYQTGLGMYGISTTMFRDPAGVNVLADLGGHWHGDGPALLPTDNYDAYRDSMARFRYNLLYADGHVKLVPKTELETAWRRN